MAAFSTRQVGSLGYVMHPYTPPICGQYVGHLGATESRGRTLFVGTMFVIGLFAAFGYVATFSDAGKQKKRRK